MRRLGLWKKWTSWTKTDQAQRLFELSLSLIVGLLVGGLMVLSWGYSKSWQGLIVLISIALAFVMLINNLEKTILAAIAISVPLGLDVSVIISPLSRNPENIARGGRTIVTLTELRLSLVLVLLVIGYALWLIGSRFSERKPIRFYASMTMPALGFVFFSVLSIFPAQDRQLSLFRAVQLTELFLAYFYLANHMLTMENMRFFVLVSMGSVLAESVLMIVQSITGLEFIIAGVEAVAYGPGRVGGTMGSPGPAAGYLSAQALIVCAMMWAFTSRSHKIFAAITFLITVIALVSTGSRIGWAAFAVTMLLFILAGLRFGWIDRKALIALIVTVLALGAIFYRPIYTRYTDDDNGSAESRPMQFRLAWNMIRARPWLGVGLNHYALLTRDYYTPDVGDWGEVVDIQIHNRYLLIWSESGTFALLCYLGFLVVGFIEAWKCAASDDRWISLMGTGLSLAILSLCIQMMTATFMVRGITLYVWLLPAMAACLYRLKQARSAHERVEAFGESIYGAEYAIYHS